MSEEIFCYSPKYSRLCPTFNFTQVTETLRNCTTDPYSRSGVHSNKTDPTRYFDEVSEQCMKPAQGTLLNKHTQLRDITYSLMLEDDRTNPQSPLHSVKSFEELKLESQLLKGIYQMGFRRPSRIQERALPQLLAYPPRNMIAQSQNGTGKTVG